MRLVVTYSDGDGCTYSCDVTIPVEYESAEALAVDLEEHCKKCKEDWNNKNFRYSDEFKGTGICASSLMDGGVYYAPDILTLEEWWEQYHV